jgi:cysteine synthase A|tara:strand:- start:184 stop:1134 length:951 start_codon:yes stop_codon:yes gene_type:complete
LANLKNERIFNNITETIGKTPLVRLSKFEKHIGTQCEIIAKLEFFNPLASVKDRIGVSMIKSLEKSGHLKPGVTIIEPTSGNTGVALAFVAASKGYNLILTMPESMSLERRKMLAFLGAKIELTDAAKGMKGAVARAEELLISTPNSIMPQQFENPANPEIHMKTTAEEIWEDTNGNLDVLISGVGTGGTITGVGRVLKKKNPKIRFIAVEPEDSPVISGGEPGPHKIQGIGAGFIPKNLDMEIINGIEKVGNQEAVDMSRLVAKLEGVPAGISSGAALVAVKNYALKEKSNSRIVVIIPSFAERYLSTILFEGLI